MKTGVIVQTRVGSTRLPGKVMLDLCGKPVIDHVIVKLKKTKPLKWFCGCGGDAISRCYSAAKENNLDEVVRVTPDCPLTDSVIFNDKIDFYMSNNYKLVTDSGISFDQRHIQGLGYRGVFLQYIGRRL